MSDDELKALCQKIISNPNGYNEASVEVATALLARLSQPTERLGAQGKLTDADCDEIARYVGVPALKLRNAVAVISRLTATSKAGEPTLTEDRAFIHAWIERERERGLLDIKLFPHNFTEDEGIKALAVTFRNIDAGRVDECFVDEDAEHKQERECAEFFAELAEGKHLTDDFLKNASPPVQGAEETK